MVVGHSVRRLGRILAKMAGEVVFLEEIWYYKVLSARVCFKNIVKACRSTIYEVK